MVNVSYPELPQPVQAHEKDSVTSPNLPESVPESPPQVHETPLYHGHKEPENHHQGLCTIQQENHLAAVMCLPISHHQQ